MLVTDAHRAIDRSENTLRSFFGHHQINKASIGDSSTLDKTDLIACRDFDSYFTKIPCVIAGLVSGAEHSGSRNDNNPA